MQVSGDFIRAIGEVFQSVGAGNFVLLIGLGLTVWSAVRGRGGTGSTAPTVNKITCAWHESDAKVLAEMAARIERIEALVALVEDRTRRG